MRATKVWAKLCLLLCLTAAVSAQRGGGARGAAVPTPPGAQGNRGGRGAAPGGNPAPTNFPAQQRAPGDPTLVARGNSLYSMNCRSCHGVDLRGGDGGGVNLLRSEVVLNDQSGELIFPVVRDGRNRPGMSQMPAMPLSQDDVKAIAEYIHSVAATAQRQGGPPPGPPLNLNVLVGDANAGKTYFAAKCSSCHSATGDLSGIGSRIASPMQLQNSWLAGNAGGGRGGNNANAASATVTLQNGQKIEGQLNRIDDFIVVLTMADGSTQSFRRSGDSPKVEVKDRRDAHRNLLPEYTDKDIHDVTAYLVTLK